MPRLTDDRFKKRLEQERILLKERYPNFVEKQHKDKIEWIGTIEAPERCGVEKIKIKIVITREYPFRPPSVIWLSKDIRIPYMIGNRVCISTIGSRWVPKLHIVGVIDAIRALVWKSLRRRRR